MPRAHTSVMKCKCILWSQVEGICKRRNQRVVAGSANPRRLRTLFRLQQRNSFLRLIEMIVHVREGHRRDETVEVSRFVSHHDDPIVCVIVLEIRDEILLLSSERPSVI